jgi:membrane protease YdiL (CAAX protease family)
VKRFWAFPLVRMVLIVVVFAVALVPLLLVTRYAQGSSAGSIWTSILLSWGAFVALLAATIIIERITTGRLPAQIGFDPRYALRDLGIGAGLGTLLFSAVVLELAAAGYYRITAMHLTPELAAAALLLIAGAATEELLFRGVIFRLIEEWAGTWIALAVSAILFGAVHAANPGATWVSSLAIALEAGVLLAAAFVVTRNLWLPIGLHFAWNFLEGPIYGTQVSGHSFVTSAFAAQVHGPAILTGGSFGPEAGLPAMLTCLAAAALLLAYAGRRSLIATPQWVQRRAA